MSKYLFTIIWNTFKTNTIIEYKIVTNLQMSMLGQMSYSNYQLCVICLY